MNILTISKALVGGAVTGLASASLALSDNLITGQEWIAIILAVIAGTGFVYATPNKPTE